MKKIYFVIFLLVAFISTSAVAEVVTTKRKVTPKQPEPVAVQQTTASSKLASNMMTCTPYTETLDSSFIGLLFNFKIQIKGWIDNKCEVDFTAEPTAGFRSFYQYADNYEKNNGIIEIVKNAILKRGIKVEYSFGGFDLVIRKKSPLGIIIMGKENENMNTFIDDYQYYHNEYEKRGWQVKVIYTLDLFLSFDKVIHDIVKEDE